MRIIFQNIFCLDQRIIQLTPNPINNSFPHGPLAKQGDVVREPQFFFFFFRGPLKIGEVSFTIPRGKLRHWRQFLQYKCTQDSLPVHQYNWTKQCAYATTGRSKVCAHCLLPRCSDFFFNQPVSTNQLKLKLILHAQPATPRIWTPPITSNILNKPTSFETHVSHYLQHYAQLVQHFGNTNTE